jgi:hypothetical protein
MNIAFVSEKFALRVSNWTASDPDQENRAGLTHGYLTPDGTLVTWPYTNLTKEITLFDNFANNDCTPSGIANFAKQYGELHAEVLGAELDDKGRLVLLFRNGPRKPSGADFVPEVIAMRRCLRLWRMVQQKDQDGLRRHVRLDRNPEPPPASPDAPPPLLPGERLIDEYLRTARYVYDSHPLPEGSEPPPPETREVRTIVSASIHPERFELLLGDLPRSLTTGKLELDLLPIAKDFIRELINERLTGSVNTQLIPTRDGDSSVQMVPKTLLTALWLQFALEVAGRVEYIRCKSCRKWYTPDGHRDKVYCSPACKQRGHREKQAKARELKVEGWSVERIAEELGSDVDTIKKWISSKKGK